MSKDLHRIRALLAEVVSATLVAPSQRGSGFIEVTPVNTQGVPLGGKLAIGTAQIVALAPAYHRDGLSRSPDATTRHTASLKAKNKLVIGTSIRLTSGKLVVAREFYQRVLWLIYRARRESVASYNDARDKFEFQAWAHEHLGWTPPAWLEAYDDRNYTPANDTPLEPEADPKTGLVTFSDGTTGIPASDGQTIFWRPRAKLNDDGDLIAI